MRNHEIAIYLLVCAFSVLCVFNAFKYMELKEEIGNEKTARQKSDSLLYAYHYIPEQVRELLKGNPDSIQIYRQIVAESGNFNSQQFQRNRNLFGFHNGKDYLKFNHWRDSYDYFMENFYCDKRYGETYCSFIRRRRFGSAGVVDYCTQK